MSLRSCTGVFVARALLAWAAIAVPALAAAQSRTVTLAWDPNPEPDVAGYVVYVSRASGSAEERFDAGAETRFLYPSVSAGVGYTFTVVAYTGEGLMSARSAPMFYMSGANLSRPATVSPNVPVPLGPLPRLAPATASSTATSGAADSVSQVCATVDTTDCYAVRTIAVTTARVTAVAALDAGRVLFVEDGRLVLVADGRDSGSRLALELSASETEILAAVPAPDFATNRLVYLSLAERLPDGRREMRIARYREVGDTLGEAATLVAGLPLPPDGALPFTVDADGRLYVAVRSKILRFDRDGGVPRDNPNASPEFAHGYERPSALAWSVAGQELWLAEDSAGASNIARVPSGTSGGGVRDVAALARLQTPGVTSLALRTDDRAGEGVAVAPDSGILLRLVRSGAGITPAEIVFPPALSPASATFSTAGEIIVVARESAAPQTYRILVLSRH